MSAERGAKRSGDDEEDQRRGPFFRDAFLVTRYGDSSTALLDDRIGVDAQRAMTPEQLAQMPAPPARARIFQRAADLLAGPFRQRLNAATMLGQSKTAFQAEIDAACELVDFWRFNVSFAADLYAEQPNNAPGTWNQVEYRPLEGFVYAATPFNFTAIAGNLPTAPALMGGVTVWKPASSAMLSAHYIMRVLVAAGLPPGVVNFVPGPAAPVTAVALASPDLAGIHFTGSTGVFQSMWQAVGQDIARYRAYPRLVGETGGKDFVVVHASADPQEVAVAIARGGFEYQGQKCSAASRIYVPRSLWKDVRDRLVVTAVDAKSRGEGVFTQIDSVVLAK